MPGFDKMVPKHGEWL